jgi:hypothetical protein
MKYDYFLNHNYKPRKTWWEHTMDKAEYGGWMRTLLERPEAVSPEFAAIGMHERDLHKHAMLEMLPFDLAALLEKGELATDSRTLLIMMYALDKSSSKPKPRAYTLRVEQAATV